MSIQQGLKSADNMNSHSSVQRQTTGIREEEMNVIISLLQNKRPSINIIYIDDNAFLLQAMEQLLSKIKCVNLTIENASTRGLTNVQAHPDKYNIALIDHDMPELNGKQLAS